MAEQTATISVNPMFTSRQTEIHKKGFDTLKAPTSAVDSYAKLKIGSRKFDDAVIDLRYYEKMDRRDFRSKDYIM